MQYLTAPELAALLLCKENQFALMARRLKALGFPFVQVSGCCPRVLRSYHDERMSGKVKAEPANSSAYSPNRAALLALQNRKHARSKATA
jgi:hypothetical protein